MGISIYLLNDIESNNLIITKLLNSFVFRVKFLLTYFELNELTHVLYNAIYRRGATFLKVINFVSCLVYYRPPPPHSFRVLIHEKTCSGGFLFLDVNSFAIFIKSMESVSDLSPWRIAKELKRAAVDVERIHVFILLARENDLSAVAVVAGLTINFQVF